MIKKTIILGLLGCALLLTGCNNKHPIDDIPNHDTSSLKKATVVYHQRGDRYYERDRINVFPSDVH